MAYIQVYFDLEANSRVFPGMFAIILKDQNYLGFCNQNEVVSADNVSQFIDDLC